MCYANTINAAEITLSKAEQNLLRACAALTEAGVPITVQTLVSVRRGNRYGKDSAAADETSSIRNTLRRPVRAGLLAYSGRGQPYQLTDAGRATLATLTNGSKRSNGKSRK